MDAKKNQDRDAYLERERCYLIDRHENGCDIDLIRTNSKFLFLCDETLSFVVIPWSRVTIHGDTRMCRIYFIIEGFTCRKYVWRRKGRDYNIHVEGAKPSAEDLQWLNQTLQQLQDLALAKQASSGKLDLVVVLTVLVMLPIVYWFTRV